jgi:hypothetical protein
LKHGFDRNHILARPEMAHRQLDGKVPEDLST